MAGVWRILRQTALAHTLFNVAGTVLIIPFFVPVILPIATSFFPNYADVAVVNGVTTYPNVAAPMAAIHTLFNLITTVFVLPFVKPFARLVACIIRADATEKPHLSASVPIILISPKRLLAVSELHRALAVKAGRIRGFRERPRSAVREGR